MGQPLKKLRRGSRRSQLRSERDEKGRNGYGKERTSPRRESSGNGAPEDLNSLKGSSQSSSFVGFWSEIPVKQAHANRKASCPGEEEDDGARWA